MVVAVWSNEPAAWRPDWPVSLSANRNADVRWVAWVGLVPTTSVGRAEGAAPRALQEFRRARCSGPGGHPSLAPAPAIPMGGFIRLADIGGD